MPTHRRTVAPSPPSQRHTAIPVCHRPSMSPSCPRSIMSASHHHATLPSGRRTALPPYAHISTPSSQRATTPATQHACTPSHHHARTSSHRHTRTPPRHHTSTHSRRHTRTPPIQHDIMTHCHDVIIPPAPSHHRIANTPATIPPHNHATTSSRHRATILEPT